MVTKDERDKHIRKHKVAVKLSEKSAPGKTLDLSLSKTGSLHTLPPAFKESQDSLRKLDLTGQNGLAKQLPELRFVGETLTWLSIASMDCGDADVQWVFLRMLKTLFVLNISHCNLTELPVDLGHVTSLKALVASHNSLTSPSLAHLASLTSLNSLILSDNKLTSIPSSLTRSKELKKLALSNNALHSDTLSEFEQMDSLEEVRLNGNTSITSIPDSLCTCKRLTLLELSHTGISKLKHIEKLSRCPRLINLGLRGTPLAESSDYREKVTTVVPQLRILDNIRFDKKFLDRKAQRDDASAWRAQPSRQDRGESYKNTEPDETAPREKKRKRHAHVPDGESPLDESVKSAATEQGTIQGKRKRAAKDNLPEPAHIKAPKSIGGTLADANSDASHKKIPQSAASMPVNAAADPAQARSSVLKVVDVRKEESKDRKQRKREKRERERQDASGTNLVADLIANTRSTVVSGWD